MSFEDEPEEGSRWGWEDEPFDEEYEPDQHPLFDTDL